MFHYMIYRNSRYAEAYTAGYDQKRTPGEEL